MNELKKLFDVFHILRNSHFKEDLPCVPGLN